MRSIKGMPVMPAMCKSCPFAEGGDMRLRVAVMDRTGLDHSQLCHHPRTVGKKKETHLCRGARDHQLELLHRLKFISEPTDEAFRQASIAAGVQCP